MAANKKERSHKVKQMIAVQILGIRIGIVKLRSYQAAFLLSFLCTGIASAMPIRDFATMNVDNQSTYVSLLVEGAAAFLKSHSQPDLAQKTISLFRDPSENGGVHQLASELKQLNAMNNLNATNPNNKAHVYEIEDALEVVLKDKGIIVPLPYLLTINKDFTPSTQKLPPGFGQ